MCTAVHFTMYIIYMCTIKMCTAVHFTMYILNLHVYCRRVRSCSYSWSLGACVFSCFVYGSFVRKANAFKDIYANHLIFLHYVKYFHPDRKNMQKKRPQNDLNTNSR